jgi:hypothetical protein
VDGARAIHIVVDNCEFINLNDTVGTRSAGLNLLSPVEGGMVDVTVTNCLFVQDGVTGQCRAIETRNSVGELYLDIDSCVFRNNYIDLLIRDGDVTVAGSLFEHQFNQEGWACRLAGTETGSLSVERCAFL